MAEPNTLNEYYDFHAILLKHGLTGAPVHERHSGY